MSGRKANSIYHLQEGEWCPFYPIRKYKFRRPWMMVTSGKKLPVRQKESKVDDHTERNS